MCKKNILAFYFVFSCSTCIIHAQTTPPQLIAQSEYGYRNGYYLADSSSYYYSDSSHTALTAWPNYTTSYEYSYFIDIGLVGIAMQTQTFNQNGFVASDLAQYWDSINDIWDNQFLFTNNYNLKNNDTLQLIQIWDTSQFNWINYQANLAEFNSVNNVTNETQLQMDDSVWDSINRQIFVYNNSNNLTREYYQYWNYPGWANENTYDYQYDNNNDIIVYTVVSYDGVSMGNSSESLYTYDSSHHMLTETDLLWNSGWDTVDRIFYSYDLNYNDTSNIEQCYSYYSGWEVCSKVVSTYNEFNQITSTIYYSGDGSFWYPFSCPNSKDYYYYSQSSGISQLPYDNRLSIYPNPSASEINVTSTKFIDELKVFNLLGQMVYESQPKQQKFSFELQNAGMYFVVVTSDNTTKTSKVIINR